MWPLGQMIMKMKKAVHSKIASTVNLVTCVKRAKQIWQNMVTRFSPMMHQSVFFVFCNSCLHFPMKGLAWPSFCPFIWLFIWPSICSSVFLFACSMENDTFLDPWEYNCCRSQAYKSFKGIWLSWILFIGVKKNTKTILLWASRIKVWFHSL